MEGQNNNLVWQPYTTEDGIEILINSVTGATGTNVMGYSRLSGIAKNTLTNRLTRGYRSVHRDSLEVAEIQTGPGLRSVHILSEDIIEDWLWSDNIEVYRVMAKAGIRAWMYSQAGYTISATPMQSSSLAPINSRLDAIEAKTDTILTIVQQHGASIHLMATTMNTMAEQNKVMAEIANKSYSSLQVLVRTLLGIELTMGEVKTATNKVPGLYTKIKELKELNSKKNASFSSLASYYEKKEEIREEIRKEVVIETEGIPSQFKNLSEVKSSLKVKLSKGVLPEVKKWIATRHPEARDSFANVGTLYHEPTFQEAIEALEAGKKIRKVGAPSRKGFVQYDLPITVQ